MSTRLRILTASTAAVLALATPFVIQWEGKRNRTYLDVAGIPTACMGQTGTRVKIGATYNDATCEAWLREELTETYAAVSRCMPVPMTPNQAAALTAFAYNVGSTGACQSAAARYARQGDWGKACRAIQINDAGQPAWSYVTDAKTGKKVYVQGLANRRAAERALCEGRGRHAA
ncbi:lysozyme [Chitinimonas arctica]|uniref:Lysozyme n=1 Tax=Chitinimonas arctica TaxID=2594795 RepID=A0A516S9T0_9NEIS|nr:lysozyme [Chitinimonas arctica]QDQ24911.1 lysozyme [Chitinimonas arctica]